MNEIIIPITKICPEKARYTNRALPDMNRIRLSVRYRLDTMNIFTGREEARGYYLHASPEKEECGVISTVLGLGCKALLLEVPRRSKKREEEACRLADAMAPQLIAWCCDEYGLIVDSNAENKFVDKEREHV